MEPKKFRSFVLLPKAIKREGYSKEDLIVEPFRLFVGTKKAHINRRCGKRDFKFSKKIFWGINFLPFKIGVPFKGNI